MPNFIPYWSQVSMEPDSEVMYRILTGVKKLEDFKPTDDLIRLVGDKDEELSVLDFGAGALRNTVGLLEYSPNWEVTAYDNPQMLDRGVKIFGDRVKRAILSSRWQDITKRDFDVVIASLVFQHIANPQLLSYLEDLTRVTNKLVIHSRTVLDDQKTPCIPLILRYFEPVEWGLGDETTPPHTNNHVLGVLRARRQS